MKYPCGCNPPNKFCAYMEVIEHSLSLYGDFLQSDLSRVIRHLELSHQAANKLLEQIRRKHGCVDNDIAQSN